MGKCKGMQLILIALFLVVFGSKDLKSQINHSFQSNYKYLKGVDAQSLSSDWVIDGFDDSAWLSSSAPFRYGDGEGGTELNDMQGNYSTVFLRSAFTVQKIDSLGNVSIAVNWDDGFVLFINGVEVLSQQRPSVISFDALASDLHESGTPEAFFFTTDELGLVEGENTIAVLACNITLDGSSDFYYDMAISAQVKLPDPEDLPEFIDSIGVSFSHPSGFYETNFDLEISSPLSGVDIVYTLDGSNPQTSQTRVQGSNPATVNINPNSSVQRGRTPGVVVRAATVKQGFKSSKPKAATFIYLENVKTQTNPGYDWPDYNVNGQHIDYWMDSKVLNDPRYTDKIETALTDIPTISIVTDNANLFDSQTGIYVNADGQGAEWERECSVELINPDGSDGFNVNAGLRIRGGWSRHDEYPKHAFRLFFRSEYGNNKLYYPLFGEEGVDRFDKIDLRCAQNYSWANWNGEHNTFIREVFSRDVQGELGQPYTRSRYYHLYLNGMYWGLFQTQERSEARYASDYFGGDSEDYDVIKRSGENYSTDIVATDGNIKKWQGVYNLTKQGYSSDKNYFKLEGKNANGQPIKYSEILVNIDNLIDYMLIIFFTGNYDAPVSAFGQNKMPNNMYAINNREDKSFGFIFMQHDAEHSLMIGESAGPGIGLYENRVNIGELTDDYKMEVYHFEGFHAQWLHYKLCENNEYKIRFADRAWEHLTGNGLLTQNQNIDRMNRRAAQIDLAIIAESARWGDTKTGDFVFTKDNAWLPELDLLRKEYFPYRTDIVIDQLMASELFHGTTAPTIKLNGEQILENKVYVKQAVDVTLTHGSGEIYYTLNGDDPRLIGGEISTHAHKIVSDGVISIPESAVLKVRALKNGSKWSAIKTVDFIAEQTDYSNFKVTELHYHPTDSIMGTDTVSGKKYEFIEFRNTGAKSAINLSGLVIDSAIYYEFPEDKLLAPGKYFIVAAKPRHFYDRYGLVASGNSKDNFANSSERVMVINSITNSVLIDFTYMDELPWPSEADGEGYSLCSVDEKPTGNPADWQYWKPSKQIHGSPFSIDGRTVGVDDKIANTDLAAKFHVYPNPTVNEVFIHNPNDLVEDYKLSVIDLKGTVLYQSSEPNPVSISMKNIGLDAGIYFLNIEQNNKTELHKIIFTP